MSYLTLLWNVRMLRLCKARAKKGQEPIKCLPMNCIDGAPARVDMLFGSLGRIGIRNNTQRLCISPRGIQNVFCFIVLHAIDQFQYSLGPSCFSSSNLIAVTCKSWSMAPYDNAGRISKPQFLVSEIGRPAHRSGLMLNRLRPSLSSCWQSFSPSAESQSGCAIRKVSPSMMPS